MDKKTAQRLGRVVNDPTFMQAFELLIEERIKFHHNQMETLSDCDGLRKSQGSIRELRYLKDIRERVKERASDG